MTEQPYFEGPAACETGFFFCFVLFFSWPYSILMIFSSQGGAVIIMDLENSLTETGGDNLPVNEEDIPGTSGLGSQRPRSRPERRSTRTSFMSAAGDQQNPCMFI